MLFRLVLALPHLIWLALWGIGAAVAAILNWLYALATGRPAAGLHRFLSGYVRYSLHVNAYLWLVADPYPPFHGGEGSYVIDLELPGPERQPRWRTFFRGLLALPALMLGVALGGGFSGFSWLSGSTRRRRYSFGTGGGMLAGVCGCLGWFASLARGRMPKGLRDAGAYGLGYGAQALAYLLLVTDRYPDADPAAMLAGIEPPPPHPVRVEADDELRRSRLTVFFRILLAVPHLVWLALWTIAVIFASIANWFATLARGTPPEPLHRFVSAYIRYTLHVGAFVSFVGGPFPGFAGVAGSYPVDVRLPPPQPQSRSVTAFRIFLVVPAWIVAGALSDALAVAAIFMWFTGVFLGRVPPGLRRLGLYALRYSAQANAYGYLVTDRYPHASPLDGAAGPVQDDVQWPPPLPDHTQAV